MDRAGGGLGAPAETFVLQGHFADPPYYELSLECDGKADADVLAERLDRALRELNLEYDSKRNSGRLGGVRAARLPEGSFARQERRMIAERRGRAEQYKHKYLLTDVVEDPVGDR